MGIALSQQRQYAKAIDYLRSAIKLQPESPWAHYAMGVALLETGDLKASSVHLEIASRHLPQYAPAHLHLAEVYKRLDRPQDSAREGALADKPKVPLTGP
jgi:predicted Zn-dependent protease